MDGIRFLDQDGTFAIDQPENYSYLYFPVAGESGIKSALTPNLGGDSKIDQNAFLMEPVSVENLHNNRSGRNFWCQVEGAGAWSVSGASAEEENKKFTARQDKSTLTAGFMWQTVERKSETYHMQAKVTSFVPLEDNVEIMYVEVCNCYERPQTITPIAAIPIFGRSADNIRDHRHVTSLLHRIKTTDYGVCVKPVLSFDERGHRKNELTYFVCGITGNGEKPDSFYPVVEDYIGEGGSYTRPWKVVQKEEGVSAGTKIEGKEAMGGIRFPSIVLAPRQSASYTVVMGVTAREEGIADIVRAYGSAQKVEEARMRMESYWQGKVNVRYDTGNAKFDCFMRWVSFQPILRRIYGCSFLPYHDYGRGGRGWRDLWQDCLSLLIMDPDGVRQMILDNFRGVRIDGTNATIIGERQGEFVADRNGIARVWMDHGVWPFLTTKLYIDQTGDIEILKEQIPYFKDEQAQRGTGLDQEWDVSYGLRQKCGDGSIYEGSVFEHLLLQHLCAFYEVGEHNCFRLRGADWNDAMDMAPQRGESVAFTCAYAGNLLQMARLLRTLESRFGWKEVALLEEAMGLLSADSSIYDDISAKHGVLEAYFTQCCHNVSGKKVCVPIGELAACLERMAEWIKRHLNQTQWIEGKDAEGWYNSYYDNDGQPVEGYVSQGVRMMLIGQVFAVMGNIAENGQVEKICKSADHYLYRKEIGGYRLNTDFQEQKFNMGRMFGFAYGEKENGAVFSHMAVMYANALYQRGFVKEGHKALQALADAAMDFKVSKIYPGIPEYFNGDGRGMYHYLTGAASWYMLTAVTEVFGVHGAYGDLAIRPKLVKSQFDADGNAKLQMSFAGKEFQVAFLNPQKLDYGEYGIQKAACDGNLKLSMQEGTALLRRGDILSMPGKTHEIVVELGRV